MPFSFIGSAHDQLRLPEIRADRQRHRIRRDIFVAELQESGRKCRRLSQVGVDRDTSQPEKPDAPGRLSSQIQSAKTDRIPKWRTET